MCTSPHRIFYTGLKTENDKDLLVFETRYPCPDEITLNYAESKLKRHIPFSGANMCTHDGMVFLNNWLDVPCGKCAECKLDHARDWSYRVLMETKTVDKPSYFLTVTYDDEHLPTNPGKDCMSIFMKRFRNKFGEGVRFFGCGEYGERNGRFHMHIIVFNVDIPDLVEFDHINHYYKSHSLDEVWQYGIIITADVTEKSAAYVARYTNKKTEDHEGFINMSRMPGIGAKFLEDSVRFFDLDHIPFCVDGKLHHLTFPRYFEKLFPDLDFTEKKAQRIENARRVKRLQCFVHRLSPERLDDYKRSIANYKMRKLERSL